MDKSTVKSLIVITCCLILVRYAPVPYAYFAAGLGLFTIGLLMLEIVLGEATEAKNTDEI